MSMAQKDDRERLVGVLRNAAGGFSTEGCTRSNREGCKDEQVRTETRTLDWFLRDKRCQKWIVQCAACLAYGRKPETPASIPKYRFEEMFPIMVLDKEGLCEQCHRVKLVQKRN